jgi:hypothetical protein
MARADHEDMPDLFYESGTNYPPHKEHGTAVLACSVHPAMLRLAAIAEKASANQLDHRESGCCTKGFWDSLRW